MNKVDHEPVGASFGWEDQMMREVPGSSRKVVEEFFQPFQPKSVTGKILKWLPRPGMNIEEVRPEFLTSTKGQTGLPIPRTPGSKINGEGVSYATKYFPTSKKTNGKMGNLLNQEEILPEQT